MVLRTRGQLIQPGFSTLNSSSGSVRSRTSSVYCLGDQKSISSVYDGKFVPGIFRVNPVVITHSVGSSLLGRAQTKHPWVNLYFNISGFPVACCDWNSHRDFGCLDGTSLNSWMIGTARLKAQSKLSAADWDAGVFIAELKESLDMLRHPAATLFKNLTNAKGNAKVWRILNASTGSWLEYRYGWLPLIKDMQSALKYFNRTLGKLHTELRRVKARVVYKTEYTRDFWDTEPEFTLDWCHRFTYKYEMAAVSNVYFNWIRAKSLLEELGLDAANVPTIVWERVPFSFVVDWFFNVSQFLAAIKPVNSVNILGNCTGYSVKERVEGKMVIQQGRNGYLSTIPLDPNNFFWSVDRFVRTVNDPLPSIPMVNPKVDSLNHLLDSLSLLWQRNNKLFRR